VRSGGFRSLGKIAFSPFPFFCASMPLLPSALTILIKCHLPHGAGLEGEKIPPGEFRIPFDFKQQANIF